MHQRTCPFCDALQSPEARHRRSCGKPLLRQSDALESAASTSRVSFFPQSPEVSAYARSFRQPHAETLPVLGALSALVLAGGAIAAATTGDSGYLYAAGMVAITFLTALLYFWFAGMRNWHKGEEFLLSDRPLESWEYTPEEWHQVQMYFYEQLRSDSSPYGCLPVLFAGIGLLAGMMIGIGEAADLGETVVSTLAGTLAGAIIGSILVLPVYLLNRSATERLRRPASPACVALGRGELFYERIHVRIDPRHDRVYLEHDTPMHLNIVRSRASTIAGRLSITYNFPSIILIPPRMASAVQEAFPYLTPRRVSSTHEV